MEKLIGRILKNRYKVIESLGRGGMAEVYKVLDMQRGVPLAMKVLREDLAEDKVFLRRFRREAANLARLQHPNIVRFYGLEQEDWLAFILMDYIDGTTLRREIFNSKKGMSTESIVQIMTPVCKALNYAHQQGIVHCDIKSANIMIDKNGKVFLADFGIARMTDAATATMVGIGSPAYMAPEVILGQDPTPQSDIYSLGIVLYEMLTGGERPFNGERAGITGTTAERVRWEHLHLTPISPRTHNPKIPASTEKVVMQFIEKEPQNRYRDAIQGLAAFGVTDIGIKGSPIRDHEQSYPGENDNPQRKYGASGEPIQTGIFSKWYTWTAISAILLFTFLFTFTSTFSESPIINIFQPTSTSTPTITPTPTLTSTFTPIPTATSTPIPTATPIFPPIDYFDGFWENTSSSGVAKFEIWHKGNTLYGHFWGKCGSGYCDWGNESTTYTGNPVVFFYDFGYVEKTLTLFYDDNEIHLTGFSHYKDNSGREDRTYTMTYR